MTKANKFTKRTELLLDFGATLIVILFLYLLLFKLPITPLFIEDDHLIFLDNAARMIGGERLYTDFFQFTFPGGQVWYVGLFKLFGISYWVLNFSILAIWTIIFWTSLRISKHLIGGPLAYLPPLIMIFFGVRWLGLDGSHRTISPIFIWVAVLLLIRSRSNLTMALVGLLCAAASFVTQQRGMAAMIGIGLYLVIEAIAGRESFISTVKKVAVVGISFVASLAAMFSYFVNYASVWTLFSSTVLYPSRYYHYDPSNNPGVFLVHLKSAFGPDALMLEWMPASFYAFGVPLAILLFFLVYYFRSDKTDTTSWRSGLLLACVGLALVVTTTAPSQVRYFPIAVPSIILLVALARRVRLVARHETRIAALASICLISLGCIWVVRIQVSKDYETVSFPRGTVAAKRDSAFERYIWLRDRTSPDEPVFEASLPYVYFLLDLKNSSRYSQFFPSEYTRPEFVAEALKDLPNSRPRFILWNNEYNVPNAERRAGDHLGSLADFVHAEYEPTDFSYQMGGRQMTIWQLRRSGIEDQNAKYP